MKGRLKIIAIIESELSRHANSQTNLGSEAARKLLAKKILEAISREYLITRYDTQETYE